MFSKSVIHSVLKNTTNVTTKHQVWPLLRTGFTSLIRTFPMCQPPTLGPRAERQAAVSLACTTLHVIDTPQSENTAKFCWKSTRNMRLRFIHWQLHCVCGWSCFFGSLYKANLLLNAHLELLYWRRGCWFHLAISVTTNVHLEIFL